MAWLTKTFVVIGKEASRRRLPASPGQFSRCRWISSIGKKEEPSRSLDKIPIVDMSLSPAELGQVVHEACTTVGFFQILNHGISKDLQVQVLEESYNFFMLPQEDKEAVSIAHSNSYRGYQSIGVNVTKARFDGHEALDVISESERANRLRLDGLTNFGRNQWPQRLPTLRPLLEHQYIPQMIDVGHRLLSAASLGLGLGPNFFRPYFSDPYWIIRLIHYPVAESSRERYDFGVGEHTDYGVFTMILSDSVKNALQIRPRGTQDWITVDPIEDSFTCNIGDMLARWTNGLYISTPHRVLRPSGESRLSVPFFFEPNYDSIIQPIPTLVKRSGLSPSFDPVMYGDHLLAKTSNNFVL